MSIEQQAEKVIGRVFAKGESVPPTGTINGDLARALAEEGLLAPEPSIIRTFSELEALDPDAFVLDITNDSWFVGEACVRDAAGDFEYWSSISVDCLPAIVLASGEQVRAARKALQEET